MRLHYLLIVVLSLSPHCVAAETIAVIGTGNVGMALGTEFAAQGHTIVYGSRQPDSLKAQDLVTKTGDGTSAALPPDAVAKAEIVVLAVPGMVVADVVAALGNLAGKIVIDVTNPLVVVDGLKFEYGVETSNGEIIQALVPDAHVIKAFNTISWPTMIDPSVSGGPVSVPLAGDDREAKERVAALAAAMGLEPIDIGGIENSGWLEMAAVIKLNNRFTERHDFDLFLRPVD